MDKLPDSARTRIANTWSLDRELRIILDAPPARAPGSTSKSGGQPEARYPRYVLESEIEEREGELHRLSPHYWMTDSFLDSVMALLLDPDKRSGRSTIMHQIVDMAAKNGGLPSAALVPKNPSLWQNLLVAILKHPACQKLFEHLRQQCDYRIVILDGGFKACMNILY